MLRPMKCVLALVCILPAAMHAQTIATMDDLPFTASGEKARVRLVPGKSGQAAQFDFENDSRSTFITSNIRGTPDWDRADGFSFWVKGNTNSTQFGGLEFIWNNDYSLRYDYCFPIRGTEWTKVMVRWNHLIPVLPRANAHLLDPSGENKPSMLTGLWFGRWWYWGTYPPLSFVVDDIRLETKIGWDETSPGIPAGHPLARTLAKLKAGQPLKVVTMGDSLTDFRHWANRQIAWPNILRDELGAKYNARVTIVNPAIGGTQLRQNLVLIPTWLEHTPEPDLVTICFGGNDWESGMRGEQFRRACLDAIDRVRRATKGRADVLMMTTIPSVKEWETRAELSEACRAAARARGAWLADTEKAFLEAGKTERERLFAWDKVHLSPAGHTNVARTVMKAFE